VVQAAQMLTPGYCFYRQTLGSINTDILMKHPFIIINFLFYSVCSSGQSISNLLDRDWTIGDSNIYKVIETRKNFSSSNIEIIKSTYYYNNKGYHIRRDDNIEDRNLRMTVKYNYDSLGRLDSRIMESWINVVGYKKDSAKYNYDIEGLKSIYSYDKNSTLTSYALVVNNNERLPVELKTFYANNSLIGTERAIYNYEKNRAYSYIYNAQGSQIGEPTEIIVNYKREQEINVSNNRYNSFGDLIEYSEKRCLACQDSVVYHIDYKYDDKNKWICMTRYLLNGKKRNKKSLTIRKIEYRNN